MMKRNILAVIVPALLVAGTANAAEIYNKDGNKVDLYGKAVGLHYFSKGNGEKQLRWQWRHDLCPSWF
ncbi:outer membrane protein F [Escherichia coli]|uniref:Outer membrane protein F n=1 Tax=Escherichia coli TaxID=562 RepID=A0A2X3KBK5_ECOLX|nr:outer membrane protein F [Escherichia coli]